MGDHEQWRGIVEDVASRECELPGECAVTKAACLPCRARHDIDEEKEHAVTVPFVAIGPEQLGDALEAGSNINCPHCRGIHEVKDSDPPMVLFYNCGEQSYVCGIAGQSLKGSVG